jgi:hypothetical protein
MSAEAVLCCSFLEFFNLQHFKTARSDCPSRALKGCLKVLTVVMYPDDFYEKIDTNSSRVVRIATCKFHDDPYTWSESWACLRSAQLPHFDIAAASENHLVACSKHVSLGCAAGRGKWTHGNLQPYVTRTGLETK